MRVTADDGHTRQRETCLGADDMDDTVLGRVHLELRDAELLTVFVERVDLFASHGVSDRLVLVVSLYVVVRHGEDLLWAEDL